MYGKQVEPEEGVDDEHDDMYTENEDIPPEGTY